MENKNIMNENVLILGENFAEVILDSFLEDGLFKDIPIVSSLLAVAKLKSNVSDIILLLKLKKFMEELDLITDEEKEKFNRKYHSDKDYKKIGSQLLLLIERSDNEQKIIWIARLFRHYVNGSISKNCYLRLANVVSNCFPDDLFELKKFEEKKEIKENDNIVESYVLTSLYNLGLLNYSGAKAQTYGTLEFGQIYSLNDIGKTFMNLILNEVN